VAVPASRLLAVITSDPDGPVARHRWRAYEEHLAAAGIVLEVVPWPKGWAHRQRAFQRASAADGVVLSSRLPSVRDTRRLRRRARRLAFDFDDALPYRDSRRGASRSRTRARRFRAILKHADRVFAGNAELQRLALASGAQAAIVPTTVDVTPGPPAPEPAGDVPTIGWIGSRATLPYLEARAVMLSALVAAGRQFRLRVIADLAPALPTGIAVEFVPWELSTWPQALADTHFGFAPLPDDPWARGKCGLKVVQMLSLGRPVVASAVGVQAEQVRHGETGFLGADREGLLAGVLALMDDGERRRAMGVAGREDVRARWSVAAWAPRVVEHVQDLLR
jgi:glycosyltransferase involved in cell wall biosynthesis